MLNVTYHQGNANAHHSEMSPQKLLLLPQGWVPAVSPLSGTLFPQVIIWLAPSGHCNLNSNFISLENLLLTAVWEVALLFSCWLSPLSFPLLCKHPKNSSQDCLLHRCSSRAQSHSCPQWARGLRPCPLQPALPVQILGLQFTGWVAFLLWLNLSMLPFLTYEWWC